MHIRLKINYSGKYNYYPDSKIASLVYYAESHVKCQTCILAPGLSVTIVGHWVDHFLQN